MCGIAGIVSIDNKEPINRKLIEDMVFIQSHRGPDERGVYLDSGIALGHARLSIIDLSTGSQPMSNNDGNIWAVYNGEVYNYVELRPELEKKGYNFKTTSDTEVLIHSFEESNVNAFKDFNGQFALAYWDKGNRRLTLARDRVGIRPLFYAVTDNQLVFASEMKAILLHPGITPELDPEAIDEIFTFWSVTAPKTVFKGIKELPPGCYLTLQDGKIEVRPYWQPEFPSEGDEDRRPLNDLVDELKNILMDSTIIRLRADVPVGAYLSGGIDSSATTAFVRNYTSNPLKTFSVTFEDKNFDERNHQLKLAEYLRTDHRTVECSYKNIGELFPEVIWHTEKPIVRTAPTPLMMLSKLVRENDIKVVLTGEGADEFLGGYDLFKEAKIRKFWSVNPDSTWRPRLLESLYPYLALSPARTRLYLQTFYKPGIEMPDIPQFSHIPRWSTTSKIKMFYSKLFREKMGSYNPVERFLNSLPPEFGNWSYLGKAQYIEIQTLLSSYLLSSQGDRMAAANSIEGRYPFLDHRLIEFAAKLPPKYKIKGLVEKYILRESVKGLIPEDIRTRVKRPYMAPDSVSFTYNNAPDYIRDLLSGSSLKNAGIFNEIGVEKLSEKLSKLSSDKIGFKDNMSFVGILSTMIFHDRFVVNFGKYSTDKISEWRRKDSKFLYRGTDEYRRDYSRTHN
ncbi:MAG: asparagine synthase (glutamine-hydrolyzing) [candidate division Zixibacteria bacterium]|nr:asparagine synthase (glutamine-hydrolyzing) [candidate division Zixibacteria bacterium]